MPEHAQVLSLLEESAPDASLELLARLIEIATTLLQGAEGSNASHADACRASARDVHATVLRLLREVPDDSPGMLELHRRARQLADRLNGVGSDVKGPGLQSSSSAA